MKNYLILLCFILSINAQGFSKKNSWYSSFDEATLAINKPHNCKIQIKTTDKAGVEKYKIFALTFKTKLDCSDAAVPYKIKETSYIVNKEVNAIWLGK